MTDITELLAHALRDAMHRFKLLPPADYPMDRTPEIRIYARACLTALSEAGWCVVPREPTDKMLAASGRALKDHIDALPDAERKKWVGSDGLRVRRGIKASLRYKAMVSAGQKEMQK